MATHIQRERSEDSSSPEDGSNFRRSLQIDMKGLVGSAIGNMSISPGSRDVVLAARKGLFIIDLEAPLNVPRFLPQGGTWDVADVQWNPHLSRREYIVSTSSEKLLIWNLYLSGKTSIEHILRSHYRAITDINWHTNDPDIVVSTGIDSWLWSWDLRTPNKPVMGLCAFNAGGTQVKWNRKDGNILASSHLDKVLIWDRRNGSLPTAQIDAHSAKIYGIDWAHDRRDEIVTCSLDKTIKIWNMQDVATDDQTPHIVTPRTTIQTAFPVWRARDLPFGNGVLSMPQRGDTALEMWSPDNLTEPVTRFEGHTDVVKEFVWRRGDDSSCQLITWSKDRTLKFWPVDPETLQKVGHKASEPALGSEGLEDPIISFSNPPPGSDLPPALSAPVGFRGILGEVRASQLARPIRPISVRTPHEDYNTHTTENVKDAPQQGQSNPSDRGYVGGRSAPVTAFAWITAIKMGSKREGNSAESGEERSYASRMSSLSRPSSPREESVSRTTSDNRKTSEGKDKPHEDHREVDTNQSLQEEITAAVNKFSTSKVRIEKFDLPKKRTCTFGLHGPWGDATSVFIRVSFTFPRDYPQAPFPGGVPQVELERNPLIRIETRVKILRRLKAIRERQRPCLEACLRFLLFGSDDESSLARAIDSESSSDEAFPSSRRPRNSTVSLLPGDKNLAEPRTSQGVFGANGQLVCFFRPPPRIMRTTTREVSASPSVGSRGPDSGPRSSRSPGMLSDAIRRLARASTDTDEVVTESGEESSSVLRIMSNLFSYSPPKGRKASEQSKQQEDSPDNFALRRVATPSTILVADVSQFLGIDIAAAAEYKYTTTNPLDWCKVNSEIARRHNRIDHERVFGVLQIMLVNVQKAHAHSESISPPLCSPLMMRLVENLYAELLANKDIQMLVMISVLLLAWNSALAPCQDTPSAPTSTPASQSSEVDYFSRRHATRQPQGWPRATPSPTAPQSAPAISSPSSSRGSWSSLFNTTNMRRFMSTVPQEAVKEAVQRHEISPSGIHTPNRPSSSLSPRTTRFPKKEIQFNLPTPSTVIMDDTGEVPSRRASLAFSASSTLRRPTFSQVVSAPPAISSNKRVVFRADPKTKQLSTPVFSLQPKLRNQLGCHILVYAEMLSAWNLPMKRSELLKSTQNELRTIFAQPMIRRVLESSPLGK
ncbi:hypothetical protein NLI96_g5740 [Meripilus lineatus]|uniref:Uncharacterized protein n=1 Tax=Meripilus lineatus TaxID=2056292 RepID=A0AAD5V2C1_9APHY|nr:hypothetical protein NLI96_g5740 [Physisporinus lineatus]